MSREAAACYLSYASSKQDTDSIIRGALTHELTSAHTLPHIFSYMKLNIFISKQSRV